MQSSPSYHEAVLAFQRGDLEGARSLAEGQIEASPTADLVHLLGLIECRSNNLEAGIAYLRRAHEMDPDDLRHRVILARALVDSGHAREALEAAPAPSGESPSELALWQVRAEAAGSSSDWEAAAEAWGALAHARPMDWRAWGNRAHALGTLKRWPEAVDCFKRAVRANPSELQLLQALASALASRGVFRNVPTSMKNGSKPRPT